MIRFALAVKVKFELILFTVYCKFVDTRVEPLYHPSKVYPALTVALNVALPLGFTLTLVAVPEKLVPAATYAEAIPVPATAVTVWFGDA